MRVMTEPGVEIACERVGRGSALLIPNAIYLQRDFGHLADKHTVVFYDLRNRGHSGTLTAGSAAARAGIAGDVTDLEAVRRHFGFERVSVLAHSYVGVVAARWAIEHPTAVERLVLIGPVGPDARQTLARARDPLAQAVSAELAAWRQEVASKGESASANQRYWELLSKLMVVDQLFAPQVIPAAVLAAPNEAPVHFEQHLGGSIWPSLLAEPVSAAQMESLSAPVLVVQGDADRSAPPAGAAAWVKGLANARLLSVPNTGHVPWIEAPQRVWPAIEQFLAGEWPPEALA